MQQKYAGTKHIVLATKKINSSDTWNRLVKIKCTAESKIKWIVGKGDINFLFDNWFGETSLHFFQTKTLSTLTSQSSKPCRILLSGQKT